MHYPLTTKTGKKSNIISVLKLSISSFILESVLIKTPDAHPNEKKISLYLSLQGSHFQADFFIYRVVTFFSHVAKKKPADLLRETKVTQLAVMSSKFK